MRSGSVGLSILSIWDYHNFALLLLLIFLLEEQVDDAAQVSYVDSAHVHCRRQ